jgi:periplasmic divalent cation tolerance protein
MRPVEVTVTCANEVEAKEIGERLVRLKVAACAQWWPIRSAYYWDGELVNDQECMLLLKTTDRRFEEICDIVNGMHSYDLPAIVMLPVSVTGPGYMAWLSETLEMDPVSS